MHKSYISCAVTCISCLMSACCQAVLEYQQNRDLHFDAYCPTGWLRSHLQFREENSSMSLKSSGFIQKGAWKSIVRICMCTFLFLEILSMQWLPWECQGLRKLLLVNTCTFSQACVLLITLLWLEFSTHKRDGEVLRPHRDISHWIPFNEGRW